MKKNRKIIIIVGIVILVILLIVLIVLLNRSVNNDIATQSQNENNQITDTNETVNNTVQFRKTDDGEQELEVLDYNTLVEVTNKISFYTVQDCIEQYLNIKDSDTSLYVVKMYEYHTENDTMQKYLARAMRVDPNNTVSYLNFIVYIDFTEMIYEVESIDNTITDLNTIDLSKYNKKLDKDKSSKCSYVYLDTTELLNNYLDYWEVLINTNIDLAYEYFDEEYRNTRFGSVDNFKEYVENNKQLFENIEIYYSLDPYDEEGEDIEYMGIDTNEYYYSISETAVMQFKINDYRMYDE